MSCVCPSIQFAVGMLFNLAALSLHLSNRLCLYLRWVFERIITRMQRPNISQTTAPIVMSSFTKLSTLCFLGGNSHNEAEFLGPKSPLHEKLNNLKRMAEDWLRWHLSDKFYLHHTADTLIFDQTLDFKVDDVREPRGRGRGRGPNVCKSSSEADTLRIHHRRFSLWTPLRISLGFRWERRPAQGNNKRKNNFSPVTWFWREECYNMKKLRLLTFLFSNCTSRQINCCVILLLLITLIIIFKHLVNLWTNPLKGQ